MRRRILVILALATLIALSIPRYVDGVISGDYARAGQMVALVWFGFFVTARYWVRDDARFGRLLMIVAALICVPNLAYHLYDDAPDQRLGTSFLLAGIIVFSYGFVVRREPILAIRPKQQGKPNG